MSTQALSGLNRPGWLTFAAIVMFAVGFLRIITAIYYFAHSARIASVANGAFAGHVFLWGLWDLGIAALALFAGASLLAGNSFGRIVGYAWAILVIIQSFMLIGSNGAYGFWMLVLATLVIFALSTTSEWRDQSV